MQQKTIRGSPVRERRTNRSSALVLWMLTAAVTLIGCESADERLVTMATENASRQADQSQAMARLQQQVAEGSKELVASEAEARREWIGLKRDLQAELAHIGQEREALDDERKAIAAQRHRDPILAAAIETFGLILACLVPLVVAAYAFRHSTDALSDAPAADLLIQELLQNRRLALPRPDSKLVASPVSDNREPTG